MGILGQEDLSASPPLLRRAIERQHVDDTLHVNSKVHGAVQIVTRDPSSGGAGCSLPNEVATLYDVVGGNQNS